jgi:TolB-like protein
MTTPTEDQIQTQLKRILMSNGFIQANRMSSFLQFVVEQALKGYADRLKEYVIGVEVFNREVEFDPRLDSIVRVEAGRLRTKIQVYYSDQGADDPLIITMPKGGYSPEFVLRDKATPMAMPQSQTTESDSALERLVSLSRLTAPGTMFAVLMGFLLVGIAFVAWQAAPPADKDQPASASGLRIAVLPFQASIDQADQIIAERLTQRVTAEFVRIGKLRVISSTSALAFKDSRGSLRDVAEALQADLLMEARLVKLGNQLRVEARVSSGAISEKFWVDDFFVGSEIDELAKQIAVLATDRILERQKWMATHQ